jgi:hypothetical protein
MQRALKASQQIVKKTINPAKKFHELRATTINLKAGNFKARQ